MDTHFYIDNAPPTEVMHVLMILTRGVGLTPRQISEQLQASYEFRMQKDCSYSPRRLFDLGLAERCQEGQKTLYFLSERGAKLQNIFGIDPRLALDLLHYLHYTGDPLKRKYFWSYRRCCQILWSGNLAVSPSELATIIQDEMRSSFSGLDFNARKGARFNGTAASCVLTWLRALDPSPIRRLGEPIIPRIMSSVELALLALDFFYKDKGFHLGDPVVMDERFTFEVSGVFFWSRQSLVDTLRVAERITSVVRIDDTLQGPSIRLMKPFSVTDI